MLIGNNLIRSSVGRFAVISINNEDVALGTTWTSPAITLRPSEHGFLWQLTLMSEDANNDPYLNIRINGANVFDNNLNIPKFPGTQQGSTWDCQNMYFPPNSVIDVTLTNPGIDAVKFSGHLVVYRFYDKDLARDYDSPDCPIWLKEPPPWLVQALLNVSGR
jgi:hypothetical protein